MSMISYGYYGEDNTGTLILLLAVLSLLVLAYIPATIAKTKGYGFAGNYIFGLFLFPFALAVALLLPDKDNMYENWQFNEIKKILLADKDNKPKNSMKEKIAYVRNLYTNIPLRPYQAKIFTNDNDKIMHSIFIRTYGKIEIDCIRATIRDYDIFGNILYETSLTTAKLEKSENGFSFITVIDSDNIEFEVINYLEVYIEAYASESNTIILDEPQQCNYIIPIGELIELKYKHGEDAVSPFEEHEDHWICVCGSNCENNRPCPVCERNFGEVNHLQAFFYALAQLSDILEIKNRFMQLRDVLPDDKFDKALNYLEEETRRIHRFGGEKLFMVEKNNLRKLLSE